MRWSIVRVIWFRELRDQLRDRRTIFMIAVLPILLYPLIGVGVVQLVYPFLARPNIIGVVGSDNLPVPRIPEAGQALPWLQVLAWPPGAPLAGPARVAFAVGEQTLSQRLDFAPLLVDKDGRTRLAQRYLDSPSDSRQYEVHLLPQRLSPSVQLPEDIDRSALNDKRVDAILVVPPSFGQELERGGKPTLFILVRQNDDHSRLVLGRLSQILARWRYDLKCTRLLREKLPANFDEMFGVWDSEQARPSSKRMADELLRLLAQIFPFVLVMWSLAGALYPAVDLCAGEKERGTMETLLISPASREEIVWGKFLTIWVFSTATALLNLVSMGVTAWQFSKYLIHSPFRVEILFWGVLLLLPLSAFFSALCLAVGVYARSTKEGQYYLMPLFLVTLPLIFLPLAPGVELNPFYSMVPVTGVALLLQALMLAGSLNPSRYILYFVPVLAPMVIYSWLALRWAIEQFQREEVLFREAERLDLRLWLRHLFRDKEALPSVGQALFCFALILALRWLSLNVGTELSLLVRTGISHLAFVATPPLFMALLLTTRPLAGLNLRLPPWWAWPVAVLLGFLVVPPVSELTLYIMAQFPDLRTLLEQYHALTSELKKLERGDTPLGDRLLYLLVLGLLPALCEEIAFRGFILAGLVQRFRPSTAILLSSFLFSLYQMNVFQFAPHFLFGCILGFLVLRTGSVLTAVVFHLVYNTTLIMSPVIFGFLVRSGEPVPDLHWFRLALAILCGLLALAVITIVAILGSKKGYVTWLGLTEASDQAAEPVRPVTPPAILPEKQ